MKESIKIVQISDCHLYEKAQCDNSTVFEKNLQGIINHIQQSHNDADMLFITGDLAQQPSLATYTKVQQFVEQTKLPYFAITGNHDEPDIMRHVFAGSDKHQLIDTQHWQFILLNSKNPTNPSGSLSDESLEWLTTQLTHNKSNNKKHVAIFMHHHPVLIHSQWMDEIGLQNPEKFWDAIKSFDEVKSVSFGHVHQEFKTIYQNKKLFATPATSRQFAPAKKDFTVDDIGAGLRYYRFFCDGTLESVVERPHIVQTHN